MPTTTRPKIHETAKAPDNNLKPAARESLLNNTNNDKQLGAAHAAPRPDSAKGKRAI
jgi:hypothetical protein